MGLLYLLAYLDRVNIGFAKQKMLGDLHFSEATYGLGVGIFFFGYFFFEVPSNLILDRLGARRWICCIVVAWGFISSAMALVKGEASFYILRFFLGAAEAGLFPGMVLYLTYWFPPSLRARMTALFFTSAPLAGLLGAPISGLLLSIDGIHGLRGWQWLFLVEGVPSVLAGIIAYFYLTDRPGEATWLTAAERTWLVSELERHTHPPDSASETTATVVVHANLSTALRDPRLWTAATIYFTNMIGLYCIGYWMPDVVRHISGASEVKVGLLVAIPYGVAMISMVMAGRLADVSPRHRRGVVSGALSAIAVGLAWTPYCHSTLPAVLALSLATAGVMSAVGPFWAMTGGFLRGTAAAGGLAVVNSLGNLSGFAGPYYISMVRGHHGGYPLALLPMAGLAMIGSMLTLSVPVVRQRSH